MKHDETNAPRPRHVAGQACLVCGRGGAKVATIRIAIADKVLADERAALCPDCGKDRHRLAEAVRRVGP